MPQGCLLLSWTGEIREAFCYSNERENMPTIDLHEKPFTEETLTKLSIFEDYAKVWIPTFIMSRCWSEINVFDFFAGTGYDKSGEKGSPIRILSQILGQVGNIFKNKQKITVYFNELDSEKFSLLKSACSEFIKTNRSLKRCCEMKLLKIIYINKPFEEIFSACLERMQEKPSLVYLDQNGVKFLQDKYFQKLIQCEHVDFLYFISSSYFMRFGNKSEFKNILDIDWENAHKNPYKYIHQHILNKLREKIPPSTNIRLYPFTIKKGSNIYGIIFGASHILAADKFLHITWKQNEVNGNANFDIDDDKFKTTQEDLFGYREFTKIQNFQKDVKQKILSGNLKTNKDVYLFCIENGHIPKHGDEVVRQIKKERLIDYEGRSPLINYRQVMRDNRIIEYRVKLV